MAVQDGDKFIVNRGGTDYQVSASDIDDKLQDDDQVLIHRGGTDYRVSGADLRRYLNAKPLEVNIRSVEEVGNDSNFFRGTVRFTTNVPDVRPYKLNFTPRRYREDEGNKPVTSTNGDWRLQNFVDFHDLSSANTATKEKFTVVITERTWANGKPEWETAQFNKPAYTANPIKRLHISDDSGLHVDGDTITFDEPVWAWGGYTYDDLTPLSEYELSNLHIRYYSAATGQKIAGGEFTGDIRDPANRTLDISSGELKDNYGNNIEDVTCRVEYKTNVTYGNLIGESGWMLPIKPFSWQTNTRGGKDS